MEARIQQAWKDYKNKRKGSFAKILTDDFIEVEADGNGARDKKAEIAEIDEIDLASYALSDFHFRAIGSDGLIVRYRAEYKGKAGGQPIQGKSAIGEVWGKSGDGWKLVYFQETPVR